MTSWKSFSADVMRSQPAGASRAERSRALKAAGAMWRRDRGMMGRNPEMGQNPSDFRVTQGEIVHGIPNLIALPVVAYGLYWIYKKVGG